MAKLEGFLEKNVELGTSKGFNGKITNAKGVVEAEFNDQIITNNSDGTPAKKEELGQYSFVNYDLDRGNKGENIILLASSEVTGNLSKVATEIRAITSEMGRDVNDTILKTRKR